ncbi:preprotein translocase subunit SecG [Bartonella tamiae]|uniref:Protein-export membrane protein SecG n=1 Tax=Bartonella tamiae Th239 TaxID=1094558 RepID=J0R4W5_9HYPH|nr:preprotein translocase subunit SecG [Bartonella tamiae]EJF90714.1 preprotein translocase, SecG subunit [Bartonella tamiae Th239]EJF93909.1 preprotein translocase, SecG subunit [Bartonella tamiae Th307]
MQTVLIVIHLLIVIALIGVVLIQRSEGGGLGIGGGSGFMTARGTKNILTRLTAILAICFFITSITLVVLGSMSNSASDILNRIPQSDGQTQTEGTQPSILEQLGGSSSGEGQNGSQDQNNQEQPQNPVPQQSDNPIPGN